MIKQFMPQVQGELALKKAAELFNQEAVRLYELGEHAQIPTYLNGVLYLLSARRPSL